MIEAMLIKPLGYAIVVGVPAWIVLQIAPEPVARILKTKIWDDPDQ